MSTAAPQTIIHSNGSKWLGQENDTIDQLCDVLARWQLDRKRFPRVVSHDRKTGLTRFFGNFAQLSHVFRIDTNDPQIIAKLKKAIRNNAKIKADPATAFSAIVFHDGPFPGQMGEDLSRQRRPMASPCHT